MKPRRGKFLSDLVVRRLDGINWQLAAPLHYVSKDGKAYRIPAMFTTDFATCRIGRWTLLGWRASYSPAAVLHDFLYRENVETRFEADWLFLEALQADRCSPVDAWKAFVGVRLLGWVYWKKRRKGTRTSSNGIPSKEVRYVVRGNVPGEAEYVVTKRNGSNVHVRAADRQDEPSTIWPESEFKERFETKKEF